jgi:type VI secretion system protein VasD
MLTKPCRFARLGLLPFALPSLAGILACVVLLAACGHDQPPPPQQPPTPCTDPEAFGIRITAAGLINPGEHGEPLATVVRIYQLKRPEKLTGASFDDILDRDKEALGSDLCEVQEVTLSPGETIPRAVKRAPDAGFIAAVALYRRPKGNDWRAVKQLPPTDPMRCHAPKGTKAPDTIERAHFFLDHNRVELR